MTDPIYPPKSKSQLLAPSCDALVRLMFFSHYQARGLLPRNCRWVIFPKIYSQNSDASKSFTAVAIIVKVVTNFEMTFTGDVFKIVWQTLSLFSKFQYLKNMAMVLSKIQMSDPGPS